MSNTEKISAFEALGFDITQPITYCNADKTSAIAMFRGYPYNIDKLATQEQWDALQDAVSDGLVTIGDYVPPPTESPEIALANAKVNASDRITAFSKAKRLQIAGTSDEAEIAGWSNKLRIAQAIADSTASPTDIAAFQAEVEARQIPGETLDIFTQKVIKNSSFFSLAVGLIDGLKRKALWEVDTANTPQEVAAVLAGMQSEAEQAFADLMAKR